MSQGDDADTDKQHEPSQKKLDDARKKGDIPKSVDLTTSAAYVGVLIATVAIGGKSMSELGSMFANLIAFSDDYSADWLNGGGLELSGTLVGKTGGILAVWFAIPAIVALLSVLAQRGFVVAPDKIQPKLSRISPISNAKNKYGISGLFEFFKSFLKLTIYSVAIGYFLYQKSDQIIATANFDPGTAVLVLSELSIQFLAIVVVISFSIGILDWLFQRQEHTRKNRMSRKELTDENKQSEGDPHMKQQRRQKGYDIATNQMLADVPEADVVIVNPTHYAVALKWSRKPGSAPECVAKGTDEIAAKIREIASANAVPIQSDPPTARALYATVEIGQEIHPDHFQAVAAAIRFAENVRKRAKAWLP